MSIIYAQSNHAWRTDKNHTDNQAVILSSRDGREEEWELSFWRDGNDKLMIRDDQKQA